MTDQPKDTRLWCLHHIGADEVYPAPDFATAQKWADWANKRFSEHADISRFVVAVWPHNADRHAAWLIKALDERTLPEDPAATCNGGLQVGATVKQSLTAGGIARAVEIAHKTMAICDDGSELYLNLAHIHASWVLVLAGSEEDGEERPWIMGFNAGWEAAQSETSDTDRLDALRDACWDLRCFSVPTGFGDGDVAWKVVGHWMSEPRERTIAEGWSDDPRVAIDAAMSQPTAEAE